jgi:hypothetical protein
MKHMPEHAERYVTETESGGVVLSVHWKLNSDPNRPNKYSKTIIIRLSRELLEDFLCWRWLARRTAGINVVAYVVAVAIVWYWGLNAVAVSDAVFSGVLIGGPPLLALCLERIFNPKKRHRDSGFSDRA